MKVPMSLGLLRSEPVCEWQPVWIDTHFIIYFLNDLQIVVAERRRGGQYLEYLTGLQMTLPPRFHGDQYHWRNMS